jgi:hypothetical protein
MALHYKPLEQNQRLGAAVIGERRNACFNNSNTTQRQHETWCCTTYRLNRISVLVQQSSGSAGSVPPLRRYDNTYLLGENNSVETELHIGRDIRVRRVQSTQIAVTRALATYLHRAR